MGSYEQKIREMQQHLPYLEEKINDIKRETALDNFPDEKREERLRKYQKYHSIINNRTGSSKVSLENLEALDRVIRTWREKDYVHERQAGRDPHEDRLRPGSSCSNTSSCSNQQRHRKLFDDTPASPSPPRSPTHSSSSSHHHSSSHQPIIIPTERRRESRWSLTPPPPPVISDHLVPITRVNVNDMAPQEWDSDGEDDGPKPRSEIVVADMVTKKFQEPYPEREKPKIEKPAKREFEIPKLPHPSDNIPTVPVNDLGGHRRLKSVLQKHDLVNDFNRLYVLPGRGSPLNTVDALRSPDGDYYMHQSPSQAPFSPGRSSLPSKPPTPSLLLNAPPTNSRLPIPIDDVAEYLDDSDRDNLRRQQASTSSRPVSRMPVPSSPSLMSPRSDANTVAPTHGDPRLPGDPRTRPNNDPRTHNVPSTDPRNHGGLPVNDPRSHAAQRYSDGYDRHKRPDAIVPNDYQRHGYAPEPQNMQPSMSMHGMPTSIPGPGSYNSYGQMAGPHNQMGHNQYDYRQSQQQQQQQQQQQHWGGSSMPPQHIQTSQATVSPLSYQMNQGSNMPGWQGMQYQQEPMHSTMNGGAPAYSNPVSNNVPRSNPPHVQPMMSNSGYITPQAPKYPNYQDNRQSYNMQQSQSSTNEYQRPRTGWGENTNTGNERYGNRPGAPFRPGGPNSWNKDGPQRPNRDPRTAPERDLRAVTDRDPRSISDSRDPRSRPEQRRPVSPPFPAKDIHKGPLPGKEVHTNKFVKPVIAEKEAAAKKRPDNHKLDANKNKDKERDSFKDKDKKIVKDKDKNKDRDKDKSKFKDKSKLKPQRNPGIDITAKYGAIDAKKGAGVLQKFKIPKKRSSIDVQQESTTHTEDWSDEDVPVASTSSRDLSKKQSQSTSLKKSSKPSDKNKEKNNTTVKHKESKADSSDKSDRKKSESEHKSIDEIDDPMELLKKYGNKEQFSLDEVSSLITKILKKKNEIETETDNNVKSRDKERPTSPVKKKKKIHRNVIESSSDESEPTSVDTDKSKPRKLSAENKTESIEKKEKDATKMIEERQLKVSLKRTINVKEKDLPDKEPESESVLVTETPNAEEETVAIAEEQVEDVTIEPTVKPKPKRRGRFRELDALQEDLKSSWICDGAMKATGSRICNQRNKALEQQQEHAEEEVTAKRTRKTTKKAAPKAKKAVPESTLLASSESEDDDMPLLRRTESLSSVDSKDTSKSKTTPKSAGKKPRIKSIQKVAPPLFDDSSNDSFTLDPSVVEPSTDISLHPEPNDKPGKKPNLKRKKTTTEVGKTAADSSSDESYISNASSSLLLDSKEKRDNNAELLDTVMSELANNPQYSVAKKRAAKKKKSNWQMGIVTKKKRKKVPKLDGSLDSLNESNASSQAHGNESSDKLNDDESAMGSNSEDLSSRVDPEALIEYTLSSGGEKLQCLLCSSHLKGIVHHYKTSHRGKEVLISRLPVTDANLAVVESQALDLKNNSSPWQNENVVKYCCRFCPFSTKGENSVAREVFYEHCTTHTGEYRFTCQVCKYEAVAKSSLRAHFYKECKKVAASKNLNEGTTEFPIPDEDRIYGYLCAKCNYVQLKKSNVEKHVKMFHSKNGADVKIHKIDMSMTVKKEECEEKVKAEIIDSSEITHKVEPKDEKPTISDVPMVDDEHNIVEDNDGTEITVLHDDPDLNVTLETIEHKLEPKPESSEQKSEKSSNLSAFVCPVELGEKDAEIQNERKKKMQEIAQSIRPRGQKSLSIADKLRDKIETSLPALEPENVPIENMEVDELNVSTVAPENCTDPLQLPEQPKDEPEEETMPIPQPIPIKEDPDANEIDEIEKGHSKIKDPLTFVGVSDKQFVLNFSNDEGSDGDRLEARAFNIGESDDSTPDQWDQPLPDVSTPVASSLAKGQMTNTILRLRNQLQKTQQSESAVPDLNPLSPSKIKVEPKTEPTTPPKSDEQMKWSDENLPAQDKTHQFIRIRRISGDKLSKGGDQTDENNEDPDQTKTTTQSMGHLEEDSGFLKIAQVVSLAKNDNDNRIVSDIRKAVEASPQKVRNVSLLKTKPGFILKRVDAPSVMTSSGETLKIIPLNSMPSTRVNKTENIISIGGQQALAIKRMSTPLVANAGSTGTTLVSSMNQPFKLVKIASPEGVTNAIKLKSAKVYDRMLQDDKLIHMYKCMGRECYYTSSNELAFSKHVKIHMSQENPTNRPNDNKKDYFKCAYCYIDCKSCDDLLDHLKKMHIFCRFCCKYCFYRAFAYSYVEIHQKFYHHSKTVHILKVSPEQVQQPPTPKRLDRKQIIKPYVCVHECNKYFFIPEAFILHLSMHHQNLSSFKCHLCSNTAQTTDLLIDHYKSHGYFKYHCMYCTIGAPTVKELHNHLSTTHYNQPPQILERCLPREIEKNVSAIDQLKIRDVDQMYRTRKGVDNDEKIPLPPLIKAPSHTLSLMTADQSIPTAKLIMPKESINSQSFVPLANLDGTVSNIRILESWNFKNSNNPKVINIRPNIQVSKAEKSTPKNDQVTFRVVTDGGITTSSLNLFEQKSLLTNQAKNTNLDQGTDSDSDIEIIEEVSNSNSSNRKDLSNVSTGKIKEELSETRDIEPKLESIEDSPSSSRASQSVEETSQSDGNDRFLTLDDVKDTGLTGYELYRCGIENCKFSAENAEDLRAHMLQCSPVDEESAALYCVHCGPGTKRFSKYSFYIDHVKTHGLKRYKCDLCKAKFSMQSHAQTHMRTKHKYVTSKIVPVDPDNPYPELGLHIVYPMTKKLSKSTDKEVKQTNENEKSSYAPNEIDKLPLQPIYNRALQCAVCSYSNKVRTNLMRHLQAHLEGESVPETGPVNPVPCLEKNEKMFDKMVNLASSSHENGRMGGGGPANNPLKDVAQSEQEDSLPKFVPENKRYVCGVLECNYLTVEEGMLRYHYRGLHSDETNYRCPHCPEPTSQESQQSVALDKMGNHLKMHDSRLYKCSHCIYHHYQRHVVERHLADKHAEKRQFVKVIRELNPEQAQAAADEKEKEMSAKSDVIPEPEEQEEQPDPDGNNWKCCMCDFKCVLKQAMQSHAASVHDEKCQFKCNGCSYKCVSKATFDQHLLTKHMIEPNIEYTTVYRKIKFQAKKTEAVETTSPQAEPFDTTPLWMRNMPRVRHIRGILLEEEEPGKGGKRKSDTDGPPKPAKAKPSKTLAQDESRTPEAKKTRNSVDSPSDVKLPDTSITSYGVPVGEFYVCTICTQYKTKYKADFRDHICRDLKYFKWLCKICDYKSVNRQGLVKHISSRHPGETLEAIQQETNDQNEEWVNLVVKTQTDIMKANKSTDAPDPTPENEEVDESEDDDLVIETKEENEENDASDEEKDYEVLSTPLSCKHCSKVFAKWRGFKRHVQLKHLQRLGYLCPYCDRSSNSEAIILQHVKSSHQGVTAVALPNSNLGAPDLTPEFWEREYGLIVPKRAKKRKRREENTDEIRSEFVCDKCDFISHSLAGFKSHLKKHETKIKQKCVYCSFSSFNASEMRQHWEVNHLQHEFRVEEAIVSSAAVDANTRQIKKTKFEDEKKALVYYCYYCDVVGSTSLDSIRSHWRLVHKDEDKSSTFKYKEHSEPGAKCAYCAEAGSKSTLINHIHEVHGADKPILLVERDEDGWMCRWCLEVFFTTKEEIDTHHKMYHSHLRRDYQLTRRVFNCRRCNKFDTISLETMQKHARTHLHFKCKFCKEAFGAFYLVKAHYKSDHPDKESEHRSINSDEVHQKQVDDIVTEASVFSSVQLTPLPVSPAKSPPTSPRIAKKSTTKQILTVVRPYPGKIKAVARKSTNPLPRYPPGIVFDIEEKDSPIYVSYYGRTASPVDLNSLSTTITAGGFKMKANCAKLAELFNINITPTLKIVDFIKERRKKRS